MALPLTVGLLTALGGVLLASSHRRALAPASLVDASVPTFVHIYRPGRKLSYRFDYRSTALLDGNLEHRPITEGSLEGTTATLTLSSDFSGTLESAVAERGADGSCRVLANLRLSVAQVELSNRVIPIPAETFATLARGFLVDYGPNGEARGVSLEEGTPAMAARLANQLVAFLQVVAKPAHRETWEAEEMDTLGEVHAHYEVLSDAPSRPDDQMLRKRTLRAAAPQAGGALGRLLHNGRSSSEAVLAYEVSVSRGILVEAAGAMVSEQLLGDLRVGLSDNRLQVLLAEEEQVDSVQLARIAQERAVALAPMLPMDPVRLRAVERRRQQEALLASVDLPAILADARTNPPPPQSQDAATYTSVLVAAVAASLEGRALLERTLADVRTGERAFLPIAYAFGEEGSPEAQAALIRVISQRPKRDPARSSAMFSLSRVEAPTAATLAWFEAVVDAPDEPWSQAALLCLGRIAGQLVASEPQLGRPALRRILARATGAANEDARALALLALGNAGAADMERDLTQWTTSESVPVRRAAISAFRLIPTVSARDVMLHALASDGDASVRYAALEGVLLRTPDDTIADAVADRLEHDADESVKKPCASRLISLCRRNQTACRHIDRLRKSGDDWTRNELSAPKRQSTP
jgi:hypothetical protein